MTTQTTHEDYGPFGEVLAELMRTRGMEPSPETVRTLALDAHIDPDLLYREMHVKTLEEPSGMCGCHDLDIALALTEAEKGVLARAYTFLKESAEDLRRAREREETS
jgi:hypothetical protein